MIYEVIDQIASQMKSQALQPPCSSKAIATLRKRSERELGHGIPTEYAQFLARTNGLVWNGLMVYASETTPLMNLPNARVDGFVEANIAYRELRKGDPMEDYLIFAEDSLVFFTYHISSRSYEVITIVGMSVLESYAEFDQLLDDALRGHV